MGSCLCRNKEDNSSDQRANTRHQSAGEILRQSHNENEACSRPLRDSHGCGNMEALSETVDRLVLETLNIIGTVIDNEPEPPSSILMLHIITDKPAGWIELVHSLMRVIPVEHPMGLSVISLLLDDSALPTKESVLQVAQLITDSLERNAREDRNMCVILGCLAEKLAGPSSIALLNEATLNYLISNISSNEINKNVKLLSLIALEKFALTSENKATIKRAFAKLSTNPLLALEKLATDEDYINKQIGFCARWALDNYFIVTGRLYCYECVDMSKTNAMLNIKDVSEYLKISADGLEARCDSYTFESVRCSHEINDGCWYYEVLLITPGVMQIGWATKDSSFLSDDGYGVGDDKYSIGFDGCRRLVWHNAKSCPSNLPSWKSGSILGCLLDFTKQECVFSLNGDISDSYKSIFSSASTGFFAAASFMSFQQCRFNFGLEDFKYPPKRIYQTFNQFGTLKSSDKIILPRHIYLDKLRSQSFRGDCCTLCFDKKAKIRLEPCKHKGFCLKCAEQLKICPMCRAEIQNKIQENS